MCGILAVLGCRDTSHSKRSRIIELSRRWTLFALARKFFSLFAEDPMLEYRRRCSGLPQLARMLRHRGPDWSGLHCHEDCYLAHQRLAIMDPTSGDQPLYNEDKTIVVTVNGEIYNHEELRGKLKSHKFRTGSDCEVIAHLYEEYGEEFVDMLDGMFSFVLLDTRDKSFIVARDAIGITPLYMGWGLDVLVVLIMGQLSIEEDSEALIDTSYHINDKDDKELIEGSVKLVKASEKKCDILENDMVIILMLKGADTSSSWEDSHKNVSRGLLLKCMIFWSYRSALGVGKNLDKELMMNIMLKVKNKQ
ncbi:asparagine synthetase [Asimina triloba]